MHDSQKSELTWNELLNSPEAKVLSAAEERELLIELVDCRKRILAAVRSQNGAGRGSSDHGPDFHQLVRDLASPTAPFDPQTAAVRPLARRYHEIRTKLIMANVRLVAHVAKRYLGRGIPVADLIQEGIHALLLALDRFDLVNSTRLATYAIWWIRQGIQRAVATAAYPVRLNPRHLRQLARAHDGSDGNSWHRPDRADSPPNSVHSQTVGCLIAATRPTLSLDARSRADGRTAVIDFFMTLDDDDSETDHVAESVGKMVRNLNPREQTVVSLRFGLGGGPRHTLIQVGDVLGVSKERVRQIEARALQKLRRSPIGGQFERRKQQRTA